MRMCGVLRGAHVHISRCSAAVQNYRLLTQAAQKKAPAYRTPAEWAQEVRHICKLSAAHLDDAAALNAGPLGCFLPAGAPVCKLGSTQGRSIVVAAAHREQQLVIVRPAAAVEQSVKHRAGLGSMGPAADMNRTGWQLGREHVCSSAARAACQAEASCKRAKLRPRSTAQLYIITGRGIVSAFTWARMKWQHLVVHTSLISTGSRRVALCLCLPADQRPCGHGQQ